MAIAYHTHSFEIPTATDAETQAGVISDKVVVPSGLAATLASYVTSTALTTTLANYVQSSAIGVTVQAYDADLAAIAALTSAADKVPYSTGAATWALADFTAAGRALIDDADAAAQRTTLGLGTAATTAATAYATAAQGALADTAIQPASNRLVPAGGTTGQVLAKTSATDYATAWVAAGAGDMQKAVFDPQNINGDAFALGTHTGTLPIAQVAGLQAALDEAGGGGAYNLAPAYFEQLLTGFHGRGMLTAETINVVTEQAVTGTSAAGSRTLGVTTGANFQVAGNVTVKHDNGRYWSYFINAISTNTLTISPPLKWVVSAAGGGMCEKTWYNRAHAGKYYIRQLAQRIALTPAYETELPSRGRLYFSQFAANDFTAISSTITYFAASSSNTADTNKPVRFAINRSAYVDVTATGQGASTAAFSVRDVSDAMLRVVATQAQSTLTVTVRVIDDLSRVIAEYALPSRSTDDPLTVYNLPFTIPGGSSTVSVHFIATALSGASAFIVDQVEVFATGANVGSVISPSSTGDTVVVVTGDSWASGDEINTPEREALATALAPELPFATVINSGLGGRRIWETNAAFATDVAAHSPQYVVLTSGVNEIYNPSDATFDPTALNYYIQQLQLFISKCRMIGAKPIIMGQPALAESDTDGSWTTWGLNARALTQSERLYANFARLAGPARGSNANGNWVKHPDGRMEVWRTATVDFTTTGDKVITMPQDFLTGYALTGTFTLTTLGSASSHAAYASTSVRATAGASSAWRLNVGTSGAASETCSFHAWGQWAAL